MSENSPTINDGPDADEIAEVVLECVRENCYADMIAFKVEEINRETNLSGDLKFDHLDLVEIIMELEERLSQMPPYASVVIPESECDEIETVGDLVEAACRAVGVCE